MQLHHVPNGTYIIVVAQEDEIKVPPAARDVYAGDQLYFYHIDGMYGKCGDTHGQPYYLAAWTEVEICGDPL